MTTELAVPEAAVTPPGAESEAAAALATAEGSKPEVPAEALTLDIGSVLAKADPATLKVLLKEHPTYREYVESEIAGRMGQRLIQERQRIEQEVTDRWQAEQETARRLRELEEMEDETLGRKVKEDVRQSQHQATIARTESQKAHRALIDDLLGELPEAQQAAMRQRMTEQPFKSYREMAAAIYQAKEQTDRDVWLTEQKQQWEQEQRAQRRQAQPRPDIADGLPAGGDSDDDFVEAFARGERNGPEDFKRARAISARLRSGG